MQLLDKIHTVFTAALKEGFCFIGLWYILYRGQCNTIQYSTRATVVIIYDTTLHPLFTPDTCLVITQEVYLC